MTIQGYDDQQVFAQKLNEVVSPARPILTIEHLIGRHKQLDRINKALMANGRSVFIYGERGVGKTSLAATAANQWQSSDNSYIDVSCAPDTTVNSLIIDIAKKALNTIDSIKKTTNEFSIKFKWLSFTTTHQYEEEKISSRIRYISDAVDVLREVAEIHSENPIIVVDEVDRMKSEMEIDKLADILKQIGDKLVPIKFIFTGVGSSLEEILGSHQSAIRQLETIELPRLDWGARWDIAINALKAFELEIDHDICVRIAAVCDGFPYYVHLIVEKLLWWLFDKDEIVSNVTWPDFYHALKDAIESVEGDLAIPYKKAIFQRVMGYEEILWSSAIEEWQGGDSIKNMYDNYQEIMKELEKEPLDYNKFSTRIRNLTRPEYGEILIKNTQRSGFYSYKEKMLRGYVRMQAEANGVQTISKSSQPEIKQYMHASISAKNVGYKIYKSTIPKGIHFNHNKHK